MNYYLAELKVVGVGSSFYRIVKADDEKQALKKVRKLFKAKEYHIWIHEAID